MLVKVVAALFVLVSGTFGCDAINDLCISTRFSHNEHTA